MKEFKVEQVTLFTSPTCVNCNPVKEQFLVDSIPHILVDVSEEIGREIAVTHGIRGVPAAVFRGEKAVGANEVLSLGYYAKEVLDREDS